MAPAADTDPQLLGLQGAVADARTTHEDLVQRWVVLDRTGHRASATALRVKVDRAFNEFTKAKAALADYISKKQRGMKK